MIVNSRDRGRFLAISLAGIEGLSDETCKKQDIGSTTAVWRQTRNYIREKSC